MQTYFQNFKDVTIRFNDLQSRIVVLEDLECRVYDLELRSKDIKTEVVSFICNIGFSFFCLYIYNKYIYNWIWKK